MFQSMAMPSMDDEEWRRTDIRAFRFDDFVPPALDRANELLAASELATHFQSHRDFGSSLLQLDGHHFSQQLSDELSQSGAVFCSMDEAVRSHRELVEPYFLTRCVDPTHDKFSLAHAAFWAGGTFLHVPRGVRIEKPLYSLTGLSSQGMSDFSHTLILLDEGAEVTLFQEQASTDLQGAALHLGANEVFVGPGATLRYVHLQNWSPRVWHFAHQRALLAQNAQLQWVVGGLGSRLAKVNQEVVLEGRGSEANVHGVMFTTERQHLSYHTRQVHIADHARSDLLYKGALQDRSRIVWRGMIRVEPNAQKTDAYQRNDSLVLSSTARNDSIPGLEIEADDVRCTHGSTAGRVDADQIFYCMARGLSQREAMHMIVEGFFGSVLDRIPIDGVRESLQDAVAQKLGF
jgi:Fe-S cluster assembly protein SufD